MWFRRTLLRLSFKSKKPKFRAIDWHDDGEVRPVTRGKAKQFTGVEEVAPAMFRNMKGVAPYRLQSNLSYSSQAPLDTSEGKGLKYEKAAQGRIRYFSALAKK
jgi:hypothetical protein